MEENQESITQQAIRLKKEKVIKGIACPSCGGALTLTEGLRTFNCKYCGSLLMIKGENGTVKYSVPRKIKRDESIAKAYNWLGSGLAKAKGLKTKSKITDAFPVYIPYWRISADVVGWVFGREKTASYTSNTSEYKDVEKKIQCSFDRTYAASDVAELGVKQVNLSGDELHSLDFETLQQDGMVFNVVSSESDALEHAKGDFIVNAKDTAKVDDVSFEHYDLVRESVSIVYYPLWVIRYSFANRVYQVVVDGASGDICYGKAPGNNLYRAVAGVLGTAFGVFLMTFFAAFSFGSSKSSMKFSVVAYIIAAAIGAGAIRWAWKKFRYGGEVEEGSGMETDDKKSKTLAGKLSDSSSTISKVTDNVATVSIIGGVAGALFNTILNSDD